MPLAPLEMASLTSETPSGASAFASNLVAVPPSLVIVSTNDVCRSMKYCWSAALLIATKSPPAAPEPAAADPLAPELAAADPAGALAAVEAAVDGLALLVDEHAAATIATLAIRMEIRCDL